MLNVGKIERGIVLDHIKAGCGMSIYRDLGLDKLDCCVAIIQNARSGKIGRKDIIKIEDAMSNIDLNALGYIDPDITINVVENGEIVEKRRIQLPKRITGVIKCHNPRCITSIEQELPHVFELSDEERKIYRCIYCEEAYKR
ncbi:MAG: aspartate carbamoyltransferase regulatory subunit [Lachnospiraceae bacterium]|jgi:aspartate carbamoyltransferase regulatory subunit|nr:aspartate carbamoyltransferase regulatory subunit [Lachnospiraceae bacterium]